MSVLSLIKLLLINTFVNTLTSAGRATPVPFLIYRSNANALPASSLRSRYWIDQL